MSEQREEKKTMKKTFEVVVDVVMSGNFYIEADTPEQAEKLATAAFLLQPNRHAGRCRM